MSATPARGVLIVDDDFAVTSLLRRALAEDGFRPHVAHTGARALEIMRGTPIDLVLTDPRIAMNGVAIHRHIPANPAWAAIPIIVLRAPLPDDRLAEAPGVVAVFGKPFSLYELLAAVRRSLNPP